MLYDKRWDKEIKVKPELTVGRVLTLAADVLEKDGWQRGGFGIPGEPRCIMGAIQTVTGTYDTHDVKSLDWQCRVALLDHLKRGPEAWNDHQCRSQSEAVRTLRKVALVNA